jgi:hypothetical protein
MSEQKMIDVVRAAMADQGIQDEVVAVGEFVPRGHTGGAIVGGMVGDSVGGIFGSLGSSIGTVGGFVAGADATDDASGLPSRMLVAVSPDAVYGFASHSRNKEPTSLVFQVPRDGLKAKVHQRVNVRVLELIDDNSGEAIELEGSRVPLTHSEDVIRALEA